MHALYKRTWNGLSRLFSAQQPVLNLGIRPNRNAVIARKGLSYKHALGSQRVPMRQHPLQDAISRTLKVEASSDLIYIYGTWTLVQGQRNSPSSMIFTSWNPTNKASRNILTLSCFPNTKQAVDNDLQSCCRWSSKSTGEVLFLHFLIPNKVLKLKPSSALASSALSDLSFNDIFFNMESRSKVDRSSDSPNPWLITIDCCFVPDCPVASSNPPSPLGPVIEAVSHVSIRSSFWISF